MSAPVPESVVASALKNPPAEEGPPVSTLSEIDQGQLGSSTGSAAAVAAPAVVVAGIVFLLLRPSLAALPRGGVALLAAGYLGLGAASLAVPGRDLAGLAPAAGTGTGREWLGALPVLAVGVAAVGLATLVAGPAPALAGGRRRWRWRSTCSRRSRRRRCSGGCCSAGCCGGASRWRWPGRRSCSRWCMFRSTVLRSYRSISVRGCCSPGSVRPQVGVPCPRRRIPRPTSLR